MNALGLINSLQTRGIKVNSSGTTLEFTIEEDINGTLEAAKKQIAEFCSQSGATAKCDGSFAHTGWKESFTITLPEEETGEFAFWKEDSYPYLGWAKIVQRPEVGHVIVEGYPASSFRPQFVLSVKEGKPLTTQLERLGEAKRREVDAIHQRYHCELGQVLAEYGKQIPR